MDLDSVSPWDKYREAKFLNLAHRNHPDVRNEVKKAIFASYELPLSEANRSKDIHPDLVLDAKGMALS